MLHLHGFHNGELVSEAWLEAGDNFVRIHNEVYRWSKEIYEVLIGIFTEILDFTKACGKKYLICTIEPDPKKEKYYRMFGFDGPQILEDNIHLYYKEVGV